jgi:hypothetical protein
LCVSPAEDCARLAAIIGDRNRPYKHVQRARIILLSAERLPVAEVAQRAGLSRPTVWRWQRRYGEAGVEGLLRDKTRPAGKAAAAGRSGVKVLALTYSLKQPISRMARRWWPAGRPGDADVWGHDGLDRLFRRRHVAQHGGGCHVPCLDHSPSACGGWPPSDRQIELGAVARKQRM